VMAAEIAMKSHILDGRAHWSAVSMAAAPL
jgi:hypothetical protein